jgi:predicted GNAT family N-acyltransferase
MAHLDAKGQLMSALPTGPGSEVDVVRADDAALLHLAQHLRYAVLVGEFKESPLGADHVRRLVADELDATGITFVAFAGAQLAGTVRINMLGDPGVDSYFRLYELPALGAELEARSAIVTRLISRSERGTAVLGRLAGAALDVVAARGARYIAIGVEEHLIAFYQSMGFTRFKSAAPSAANPKPMTLMTFDFEDPRHREKKTLAGWLYPKLFSPDA